MCQWPNIRLKSLLPFQQVQHRLLHEDKSENLKKLLLKEDSETAAIVARIEKDWPEKQISKYFHIFNTTGGPSGRALVHGFKGSGFEFLTSFLL